jgi:hypothetical protein
MPPTRSIGVIFFDWNRVPLPRAKLKICALKQPVMPKLKFDHLHEIVEANLRDGSLIFVRP